MLDLFYWPTGNGKKITIMLEECALPYRVIPVNINKGDQHTPEYEAINHLTKGLSLLDALQASPDRDQLILHYLGALAPAYIAIRGYAAPEVGPILRRSSSTWARRPGSSCRATRAANTGSCSWCTGRLAVWARAPARRTTFSDTRRRRSSTPCIGSRRK